MREFSAADARAVTGATQRQLDYWDDQGIVAASISRKSGKGNQRRYSYRDLVKLRVVIESRKAGVSLQKIRRALRALEKAGFTSNALANKKILTDGRDIFMTTSDPKIVKSVLKGGQLAFSVILVGDLVRKAENTIQLYVTRKRAAGERRT